MNEYATVVDLYKVYIYNMLWCAVCGRLVYIELGS